MANGTVVDELIVQLSLDAEPYRKVEADIERDTDRTFRKQQDRARQTDRTNKDQQRRLKDVSEGVRSFARQVTAAVGVVTGLGVAVGGALTGFLGFETALRRQAVGTGLSNRQLQAWSATARRLGADAQAGADAIANLAKERQQFNLTGNGPTLQALARMGVNVDPSRPLEDVLAQAQTLYRAAPVGQQQQFENTLSAQGVSADLILMIKSERDVREAFAQSFSQATEENRKALDQLADSLESMKATAIQITATLLEALQPAIEVGAKKLSEFANVVAEVAREVQAAGGTVDAFQAALDRNVPMLGTLFEGFRLEAQLLSDGTAVITNQFREAGRAVSDLGTWIVYWLNKVRAPWGSQGLADDIGGRIRRATGTPNGVSLAQRAAIGLSDWWGRTTATARAGNAAANGGAGLPVNIEDGSDPRMSGNPNGLPRNIEFDGATSTDAQTLMTKLTTQYGLTAAQAAAVVANWQRESSLRPNAYNGAGGGTGARGLAQWRGARTEAFKRRYGVTPDQASVDQQVEFALTDPYERALLDKSFAAGGSAEQLGASFSHYYEAHGNVSEDARRGRDAQTLANQFTGTKGAQGNTTVNIQNMTVKADEPGAFVGGIQRLSDSQNYNSVQR